MAADQVGSASGWIDALCSLEDGAATVEAGSLTDPTDAFGCLSSCPNKNERQNQKLQ